MTKKNTQKDSRGRLRSDSWTVNDMPSLTIQSDRDEADIGKILDSFRQGGIQNLDMAEGMFLDVSGFTDFTDVQNQTVEATRVFMELPSKVREIFNHDVAEWLDTAHDDDKRERLIAGGFLAAPKEDQEEPVVAAGPGVAPVEAGGGGEEVEAT